MKHAFKILLLISVVVFFGCATYQPRIGMTYDEWRSNWARSDKLRIPKMVAAQERVEVWTLGDGAFLYFDNGRLVKIDQGQLAKQRMQVEIINR